MWILSAPQVDGTASSILLSRVALGQGSTSGFTVEVSDCGPSTRYTVSVDPARSMGGLLASHWMGHWVGRTGSGQRLRKAGADYSALSISLKVAYGSLSYRDPRTSPLLHNW